MNTPSVLATDGVFCCQGVLPSRPEKRSKPNAGKDFGELAVDGKRLIAAPQSIISEVNFAR